MSDRFIHSRLYLKWFIFVALLGMFGLSWGSTKTAVAQQSISPLYSQDFDSIGVSATASLPTYWRVDKSTTVRTVGSWVAAVSATEQREGNDMVSNAANGIYNYGAGDPATATDRAIGWISSGSATKSGNLYLQLTNNTGAEINALALSYDVEKYRSGSNTAGFRIQLYYSTDGSAWTSAGPTFLTSFPADADNSGFTSAPGATVAVTGNLNFATPIAMNQPFYLAWNYSVTSGTTTSNAQALGIDNVSVSGVTTFNTITLDGTLNSAEWASGQLGTASGTTFGVTWDDDFWYFGVKGGFSGTDFFMIGIDVDPGNETSSNSGGTVERCGAIFPTENKPDYILTNRQNVYTRESWGWNGGAWDQNAFNPTETSDYDFSGGGGDYEVKLRKSTVFANNEDTTPVGFYLWLANGSCEFFNAWPPENNNAHNPNSQFLYAHTRYATTDANRTPDTYGSRIAWAANNLSADSISYNFFGEDDAGSGNPWLRMTTTASGAGGAGCTVRAKLVGNNSFSNSPFVGINRFVDFTLTNCTNLQVDVQMRYETSELNGVNEAAAAFYRCAASPCAPNWTPVAAGTTTPNPANNNLLLTNVLQDQFSYWTISDSNTPTAVSLQSFSAQPNIFLPLLLAAIVALLLSSALIIWQRKRR